MFLHVMTVYCYKENDLPWQRIHNKLLYKICALVLKIKFNNYNKILENGVLLMQEDGDIKIPLATETFVLLNES